MDISSMRHGSNNGTYIFIRTDKRNQLQNIGSTCHHTQLCDTSTVTTRRCTCRYYMTREATVSFIPIKKMVSYSAGNRSHSFTSWQNEEIRSLDFWVKAHTEIHAQFHSVLILVILKDWPLYRQIESTWYPHNRRLPLSWVITQNCRWAPTFQTHTPLLSSTPKMEAIGSSKTLATINSESTVPYITQNIKNITILTFPAKNMSDLISTKDKT